MNTIYRIICFWMRIKSFFRIITKKDFSIWAEAVMIKNGSEGYFPKYETAMINAWVNFQKREYPSSRPPLLDWLLLIDDCKLATTKHRLIIAWVINYGLEDENEIYELLKKIYYKVEHYGPEAFDVILNSIRKDVKFTEILPFLELVIQATRIDNSIKDKKTLQAESEKVFQSFAMFSFNPSIGQAIKLAETVPSHLVCNKILMAWIEKYGIKSRENAEYLASRIKLGKNFSLDAIDAFAQAVADAPDEVSSSIQYYAHELKAKHKKAPCPCLECQIGRSAFTQEEKSDLLAELEDFEVYLARQQVVRKKENHIYAEAEDVTWKKGESIIDYLEREKREALEKYRQFAKEFCASEALMAMVEKEIAWLKTKEKRKPRIVLFAINHDSIKKALEDLGY